jgi:hypothetical protein
MKFRKVAVPAFFALFLFLPIASLGQPEYPNEVGVYLDSGGTSPTGVVTTLLEPVTVYVVLVRPTDVNAPGGGEPLELVQSFEFMLSFDNPDPLVMLNDWIPPGAINLGEFYEFYNFELGYLEYIVGVPDPRVVIDEAIHLVEITFLPVALGVTEVRIGPSSIPSIPGQMVFLGPWEMYVMHPVSGDHDAPVFIFNGEAVPVETESFGSVKALYR